MSFCGLFCKRIHETKGQFNTLRLWGSACFVVCAPCLLLALHRVYGNSHVTTNNTKRTRPKNNCKKIKIYYYCHTAFVIGWLDMSERFSINFSEEWLLLLHKNLKFFLFPCLRWFIFAGSSSPHPQNVTILWGTDSHFKHSKTTPKAQRIIYSDSSRSLFYSEIANDICSTMC